MKILISQFTMLFLMMTLNISAYGEEPPFFITEATQQQISQTQSQFQKIGIEFKKHGGQLVPVYLKSNPRSQVSKSEKKRIEGAAYLIVSLPQLPVPSSSVIFLKDPDLYKEIKETLNQGVPIMIFSLNNKTRGFVVPPKNHIMPPLRSFLLQFLDNENPCSCLLGITQETYIDVLAHEKTHISDFNENSVPNRVMKMFDKYKEILDKDDLARLNLFTKEYSAYRAHMSFLQSEFDKGREKIFVYNSFYESAVPKHFTSYFPKKEKSIHRVLKLIGKHIDAVLKKFQEDKTNKCALFSVLDKHLDDPKLPLMSYIDKEIVKDCP